MGRLVRVQVPSLAPKKNRYHLVSVLFYCVKQYSLSVLLQNCADAILQRGGICEIIVMLLLARAFNYGAYSDESPVRAPVTFYPSMYLFYLYFSFSFLAFSSFSSFSNFSASFLHFSRISSIFSFEYIYITSFRIKKSLFYCFKNFGWVQIIISTFINYSIPLSFN